MLLQLLEAQIAIKILSGAQQQAHAIHPLDYCYLSLGVQLRCLDRESYEFEMVRDYAYRSAQKVNNDVLHIMLIDA